MDKSYEYNHFDNNGLVGGGWVSDRLLSGRPIHFPLGGHYSRRGLPLMYLLLYSSHWRTVNGGSEEKEGAGVSNNGRRGADRRIST